MDIFCSLVNKNLNKQTEKIYVHINICFILLMLKRRKTKIPTSVCLFLAHQISDQNHGQIFVLSRLVFKRVIFMMKANSNVRVLELFSFGLMNEKLLLKLYASQFTARWGENNKNASMHWKKACVITFFLSVFAFQLESKYIIIQGALIFCVFGTFW